VTAEMDRDLQAFVRGDLTRDQLVLAHGAEAERLADLHERIELALETRFDEDESWTRIVEQMDAGATVTTLRRSHRPRRALALAIAAALTIGGSAFAAVEVHVRDHQGPEAPVSPTHIGAPVPTPVAPPPGKEDGDEDGGTATESTASHDDGGGTRSGETSRDGSGEDTQGEGDQGTSSGDADDQGTSSGNGSGSGNDQGTSGDGGGNDQGSSTGDGNDQGDSSGDGSGSGNDQGTSGDGGNDQGTSGNGGSDDQGTSQGQDQN
jgi:hypothetical protein